MRAAAKMNPVLSDDRFRGRSMHTAPRRGSVQRRVVLLAACTALATGPTLATADSTAADRLHTRWVRGDAQLAAAVAALGRSGGRIVLRPGAYRELVVSVRPRRRLRITGPRGARIERVLFDGARRVSLGGITLRPARGDALIEVTASRHVELHDLLVTAQGTRHSASILLADARHVTIRRSRFTHCGDRAPDFVNCLLLYRPTSHVTVEDSWFHDCRGCDFVHGRFRSHLTLRRNRFERALPCRMGRHRCGHQDLVELFTGKWLRVEGNHFGVYRRGGAQLYITNDVDHALIRNNVFVGNDRRYPRYRARMGVIVGSAESKRLPHYARVVNNTILTGAARVDGYAGSIRMSSLYGRVPRVKRPVVANNILGLLKTPSHVCSAMRASVGNVVIRGNACSPSDQVGWAHLDRRGRPTAASWRVIDRGSAVHAPPRDVTGRRRLGRPDIGAYEYRGRQLR